MLSNIFTVINIQFIFVASTNGDRAECEKVSKAKVDSTKRLPINCNKQSAATLSAENVER